MTIDETQDLPAIELRDWHPTIDVSGVTRLHGYVFGDPRRPDGTEVTTSRVTMADGRSITTRKGSRYSLGDVEPAFNNLMFATRPGWDPENPIQMVTP